MRESWRDVAHLLRLAALFAVGILAFLVLRAIFVPAGFGELGHFRSGAMGDNAARPLSYAGRTTCADCHDQEAATLAGSAHARIGCESCHGASSGWLASHYAVPATHAKNVENGLVPLENASARASVCLDCHFGSAKPGQFVTHSMMAAGHPRISFELDLFSALQLHWDEDADYVRRKGRVDNLQLWAVGQAEAVQRSLSLFATSDHGSQGIFPEFYFYDCHSCHRQIYDRSTFKRSFETNPGRPIRFGTPPYNDENIIMLSAVSRVLAPGQAETFDAASRNFHAAMNRGRGEAVAAARKLNAAADALSRVLAARGYSADTSFAVISAIAGKAISPRFTDYAGSTQAVMAIDTLLNALVRQGRITVGAAAGIRANINRAYAAVASPEKYDPATFRVALGRAAGSIEALR